MVMLMVIIKIYEQKKKKKENLESTCGHIRQTNIWQQTYTATGRDISDKVTALNVTKAE